MFYTYLFVWCGLMCAAHRISQVHTSDSTLRWVGSKRFVSFLHSVYVTICLVLYQDVSVHASAAYFVWELMMCASDWFRDVPNTIHAVMCSVTYGICVVYGCHAEWAARFLAFELSSPFYHLSWLGHTTNHSHAKYAYVMFYISFFLARILYGVPLVMVFLWHHAGFYEPSDVAFTISAAASLCLNTYWFWKLTALAKKKI